MSSPIIPPFATKASYQNSQYATGTYTHGNSQVFAHLVTPPSSGVASENASKVRAQAKGFSAYSAANEVQLVSVVGAPTGGTFKLKLGAKITTALVYNATALQVQTALNALSGEAPAATGGTNEVQSVTVTGTPTGGSFTLTYAGQTTAAIPFNATATQVQNALANLSNIGTGNVSVVGSNGGPFQVTFLGTLQKQDIAAFTATASLTGGTTPGVTIATPTAGVAGTPSITVAGSNGGPFTVTFNNVLAGTDVAALVPQEVQLTGGTQPKVTVATTTGGKGAFVNAAIRNTFQHADAIRDRSDSAGGNHF